MASVELPKEFINYLNQCGSPYHVVQAAAELLDKSFQRIQDVRSIGEEQFGYMIHRDTSLIAWARPKSGRISRFKLLVSHSDSPCLRLRPHSYVSAEGLDLLGVFCYGGGLWHSWFDRGLGLAGTIQFVDKKSNSDILLTRRVRIPEPIALLPNLCIHLQSASDREAFKFNNEDQLRPFIATADPAVALDSKASAQLLKRVADEAGIEDPSDIKSWDLCLFDSVPARFCGLNGEYIDGPGLDNRTSVFASIKALNDVVVKGGKVKTPEADEQDTMYIVAAFDNEECGSQSAVGADSSLMERWLSLLIPDLTDPVKRHSIVEESILISCDAAHATHPNYAAKHQAQHKIALQKGTVVKIHANLRYVWPEALLGSLRAFTSPIQEFVVRNDCPCGSTVGPMLSSRLGLRGFDCGMPILAMHSIREICGVQDVNHLVEFLKECFMDLKCPPPAH